MTSQPVAAQPLSLVHRTRWPQAEAGRLHPTIVALHGRGSHEGDLIGLADYLDPRLAWVSPRAPLRLQGGYEWYRLEAVGVPEQSSFAAALDTAAEFVRAAVAAYPIDPARVYLLGFSQGGMVAYALTLTQPALMAGMIAHSSYLPLAALQATATLAPAGVAGKPILALHGTRDPLIPLPWAQAARDYVAGLGAQVTYQEFPISHTVSDASLAAMQAWLQTQLGQKAD